MARSRSSSHPHRPELESNRLKSYLGQPRRAPFKKANKTGTVKALFKERWLAQLTSRSSRTAFTSILRVSNEVTISSDSKEDTQHAQGRGVLITSRESMSPSPDLGFDIPPHYILAEEPLISESESEVDVVMEDLPPNSISRVPTPIQTSRASSSTRDSGPTQSFSESHAVSSQRSPGSPILSQGNPVTESTQAVTCAPGSSQATACPPSQTTSDISQTITPGPASTSTDSVPNPEPAPTSDPSVHPPSTRSVSTNWSRQHTPSEEPPPSSSDLPILIPGKDLGVSATGERFPLTSTTPTPADSDSEDDTPLTLMRQVSIVAPPLESESAPATQSAHLASPGASQLGDSYPILIPDEDFGVSATGEHFSFHNSTGVSADSDPEDDAPLARGRRVSYAVSPSPEPESSKKPELVLVLSSGMTLRRRTYWERTRVPYMCSDSDSDSDYNDRKTLRRPPRSSKRQRK